MSETNPITIEICITQENVESLTDLNLVTREAAEVIARIDEEYWAHIDTLEKGDDQCN